MAGKFEAPPYESMAPSKDGSKHERLFWRNRKGPGHLLFLMRLQMLLTSIILAVMYTWLNSTPQVARTPRPNPQPLTPALTCTRGSTRPDRIHITFYLGSYLYLM